MIVVGAGLGGLIAASQFPTAAIFEKAESPTEPHQALLRFRSDAVAKATGVEFRKVRVWKAVWDGIRLKSAPELRDMNLYSAKVIGKLTNRSIGDCSPVDRWIAPMDFHAQLQRRYLSRIHWGVNVTSPREFTGESPTISTMPLPILSEALGDESPADGVSFPRSSISVIRFKLRDSDIFQTVYVSEDSPLYRLSVTGETVIAEFVTMPMDSMIYILPVLTAMGIAESRIRWETITEREQQYGKIAQCSDDSQRRALIIHLTMKYNIYSLGRFATWRNILLDDYIQDIEHIRHMIDHGSYHIHLRRK